MLHSSVLSVYSVVDKLCNEDAKKQDVFDCQHLFSHFLCILPVIIFYVGECPAHACKQHHDQGGKTKVKEFNSQGNKVQKQFQDYSIAACEASKRQILLQPRKTDAKSWMNPTKIVNDLSILDDLWLFKPGFSVIFLTILFSLPINARLYPHNHQGLGPAPAPIVQANDY
jgi:hypothetical protein